MSTTIDVSIPSDVPAPDPTIEEIVAQHLKTAEASGTEVVKDDSKPAEGAPSDAPPPAETPPATEGEPAAEPAEGEPKADDVTAARVRKMLAKLDEREAAIAAREAASTGGSLEELLRSPKAFLARHGKSIDDVIDASIAEGKAEPTATGDDNPRLTALERRIEQRERAETQAQQDRTISDRKAEIARDIKASAKYPLINESDRAAAVTDFMVEYHSIHGKAITWDRAAALVEADLRGLVEKGAKKLGWNAPAAKPAAVVALKDRPGTVSLSGDQRTSAPTDEALPEDPEKLMKFLVARAGLS